MIKYTEYRKYLERTAREMKGEDDETLFIRKHWKIIRDK